jgi:hypothetical protein
LERIVSSEADRRTNPLRSALAGKVLGGRLGTLPPIESPELPDEAAPAIARRAAQLPAFAPLLDELEIAGWSSHRRALCGTFHDWLMLEGRRILVAVGGAVGAEPSDAAEAALVGQAAWAAIRAHAFHVCDAGELLSLAARSFWPVSNAAMHVSVAVALLDMSEGRGSVAMAGECLAWRIRAACCEPLPNHQPMLGEATDFTYGSQLVQLSLRERLVLLSDNPLARPAKLPSSIAASFARLNAESHRRMMAADAVALVRRQIESRGQSSHAPSSVVVVRRR